MNYDVKFTRILSTEEKTKGNMIALRRNVE